MSSPPIGPPPRSPHDAAVALLRAWSPPDPDQADRRQTLLDFLDERADALDRSCPLGHLTGSALVVDHRFERALLHLHAKVGLWLQMGGHCDPTDPTLADTARREAEEESGITGLALLPGPVDLDIHAIECPRGHPNRHLDVRWLVRAPADAVERMSDESLDLRWFDLSAPPALTDDSTRRLFALARAWADGYRPPA